MTNFSDREQAFEAQFARDEDMQFRVTARRNKLVGLWAAERMGLTASEAAPYATSVVQADFEEAGDEDVVRKIMGDLFGAGIEIDATTVHAVIAEKMIEARRQLMESQ